MERKLEVTISLNGNSHKVGTLWVRSRHGKESASFSYSSEWLDNPERFAIEPLLELKQGRYHTAPGQKLFGAIADSAPDRWGRRLIQRDHFNRAEQQSPRTLLEIDYLLGVEDALRLGALRYKDRAEGDNYLAHSKNKANIIPPFIALPKLLNASRGYLMDEQALKLILLPGSSLGGARPKVAVMNREGRLGLAKFNARGDDYNTVAWEAVALKLAQQAGIAVPKWELPSEYKDNIIVIERFDRRGENRIPFISAMSMLQAADNEQRSYLDIAENIAQHGSKPKDDLKNLWRRMAFNVLISNFDDHLRNHAFLYDGNGWHLSPAYDLNPTPVDIKQRFLSTRILPGDANASLELAISAADYFDLTKDEAKGIAAGVNTAIKDWRSVASGLRISDAEIKRMASAFEHHESNYAAKLITSVKPNKQKGIER